MASKYKMHTYSRPADGRLLGQTQDSVHKNPDRLIAIIADGIGTGTWPKLASFMAASMLSNQLGELHVLLLNGVAKDTEVEGKLVEMMKFANFFNRSTAMGMKVLKSEIDLENWGSTLDCCLIYNDVAYLAHVGDADVYAYSNKPERLFKYHSYPNGTLYNHIGLDDIKVDTCRREMKPGDVLLLATDGLRRVMSEEQIAEAAQSRSPQEELMGSKVRLYQAIEAAPEIPDDITFVLMKRLE